MKNRRVRRAGIGLIVLLAGCAGGESTPEQADGTATQQISFREDGRLRMIRGDDAYVELAIEIADTDSSRLRGMMQRDSFPEMSGMLFVFPYEAPQGFWMANTPLSLDILFADDDSVIVHVAKYTRPLSPDNVRSEEPARFVLEVPAGFVDRFGIIETDRMRWHTNH